MEIGGEICSKCDMLQFENVSRCLVKSRSKKYKSTLFNVAETVPIHLKVTVNVSAPVQLDKPMTVACIANMVISRSKVLQLKNFDRRNFGTGVSSRCPVQKEPKHLLLQLGMMVVELGNSSIHRSVKTSTSEQTSFSTRMSKRAIEDPKICEVLVDKVKSRDLGDWR